MAEVAGTDDGSGAADIADRQAQSADGWPQIPLP
jgi:hypothetical protein